MSTDPTNPQLLDLAGIAELIADQLAERGVLQVMSLGGGIGALLVRVNDQGTRAWTLEAAAEHHGLDVPTGLACFALWRGCYESWSLHAGDLRLAELVGAQQVLGQGEPWEQLRDVKLEDDPAPNVGYELFLADRMRGRA